MVCCVTSKQHICSERLQHIGSHVICGAAAANQLRRKCVPNSSTQDVAASFCTQRLQRQLDWHVE